MKEEILKLRQEGKSYKQIRKILGCSLGTIAYHCGDGQKEKYKNRSQKNHIQHSVNNKSLLFYKNVLKSKNDKFRRKREGRNGGDYQPKKFTYIDVIKKYGTQTICYLTGRKINLLEPKTYQFDHIVPASKGGGYDIDNLGIACKQANCAKADMFLAEFVQLCKEVLEHRGYQVIEKNDLD